MGDLQYVVFLGERARFDRLVTELDFPRLPTRELQRLLIIVNRDRDLERLRGYRPEAVCFIPAEPTPRMMDFMQAGRHTMITFEETKEWLRGRAEKYDAR